MADYTSMTAVELSADTQTAFPADGIAAGDAGTYTLNICNDSDAEVFFTPIYVTSGAIPTGANKIRPAFSIEARGWRAIQPISLGEGYKVFVEADAPCAVQLIGKKES